MSTMTAAEIRPPARRTMFLTEARLLAREPIGVLWGFALPVVAFVVLGAVPALRAARPELDGASYLGVYENEIVLLAVTMLGLTSLAQIVANYRERGVLRRLAVTPMPAGRLLGTQVVLHAVVALSTCVLVLVVGEVAFGAGPGTHTALWLLTFVLSGAAMLGLGVLVAAVSATGKVAGALGPALFFPLMFAAGLWIPRPSMPSVLRGICDWTPLGAADRAMLAAADGRVPPIGSLLVLLVYAVLFTALAVRWFRWE